MELKNVCPECGAPWGEGRMCQDHFHQMLFWENEYPLYREVHHLAVLCYHLQHPSLYSLEGLRFARQLLVEFLEQGLSPEEARRQARPKMDSGKRAGNIKKTSTSAGAYEHPPRWTITAADVIAGGVENYCQNVRGWAGAILEDLRASGNLPLP